MGICPHCSAVQDSPPSYLPECTAATELVWLFCFQSSPGMFASAGFWGLIQLQAFSKQASASHKTATLEVRLQGLGLWPWQPSRERVADNQTGAGICLAGCPLMHNLHPRSLHVQAGITASTKRARNRGEKRGSLTILLSPPPPFPIILNLLCLPSWTQFLCSPLRLPTAAKMSYSGLSMAALVGIATLIVYLVIDRVRGHSRLKHIPGPFGTGWTDLWMLRAQLSGRMCFLLAEANEKYGKVSRSHKSALP